LRSTNSRTVTLKANGYKSRLTEAALEFFRDQGKKRGKKSAAASMKKLTPE
jgi:hypothetical protein